MPDSPHRVDSWVQVLMLLGAMLAAAMHLEGRLASVEQAMRDETAWHEAETHRMELLENMILHPAR